ncbi:hypothetical protein HALA3H3_830064 [Halomonas sp. A3H3]|nr:hypothetical protein HALA3H3_830064 [Halomonas sp. A3H3]
MACTCYSPLRNNTYGLTAFIYDRPSTGAAINTAVQVKKVCLDIDMLNAIARVDPSMVTD